MSRTLGSRLITFQEGSISGVVSLSQFSLNVQGNCDKSEESGIAHDAKKINLAAQRIYHDLNSQYYKKHLNWTTRVVLWLSSFINTPFFAKKISAIVNSYLHSLKDIETPLLVEESVSEESYCQSSPFTEIVGLRRPQDPTPEVQVPPLAIREKEVPEVKIDPWANSISFQNFLLLRKLEEKLKKEYPEIYSKEEKIPKEILKDYLEMHPWVEEQLKREVEQEVRKLKGLPLEIESISQEGERAQKASSSFEFDVISDEASLLETKLIRFLKQNYPKIFPEEEISAETLSLLSKKHPEIIPQLEKEVEKFIKKERLY
jgi:hypothetical protein